MGQTGGSLVICNLMYSQHVVSLRLPEKVIKRKVNLELSLPLYFHHSSYV